MLFTKKSNRKFRRDFKRHIINPLKDRADDVKEFAHDMWYGRAEFTPSATEFIEKNGNALITSVNLNRDPVPFFVQGILESFSNVPYERLFHLRIDFQLDNGVSAIMEKNQSINISAGIPPPLEHGEQFRIGNIQPVTLNEFIKKTQDRMGVDAYFSYSTSNNCQIFVLNCLRANGVNNPLAENFLLQDASRIFKNHPNLRRFADAVVSVATKGEQLMGNGLDEPIPKPVLKRNIRIHHTGVIVGGRLICY